MILLISRARCFRANASKRKQFQARYLLLIRTDACRNENMTRIQSKSISKFANRNKINKIYGLGEELGSNPGHRKCVDAIVSAYIVACWQ